MGEKSDSHHGNIQVSSLAFGSGPELTLYTGEDGVEISQEEEQKKIFFSPQSHFKNREVRLEFDFHNINCPVRSLEIRKDFLVVTYREKSTIVWLKNMLHLHLDHIIINK